MKTFLTPKKSLVAKLALAFILTAVPPMLLASRIASSLVSDAADQNTRLWLRDATRYLLIAVNDTAEQLTAMAVLLEKVFAETKISLGPRALDALVSLDADFVLLKNAANGETLFSSVPLESIASSPLYPDSPFTWVSLPGGESKLAIVVRRTLQAADGSSRVLELGSWFSLQLSESEKDEPLGLLVFVPEEKNFVPVYVSASAPTFAMPLAARKAIQSGAKEFFISDAEWLEQAPAMQFLAHPIRNDNGNVLAVFVTAVRITELEEGIVGGETLFWLFFICGTLLSGCIGYFLARRLVLPIKRLNDGVKTIAAGDLTCRVEVGGADEIADLSEGFNRMAEELEVKRHESIQSARQERSSMLGEIALGFAHEIRNPLVIIKTSAELVHNRLADMPKEARLLGFVVKEVGRIDSLLTQFLAFAKPTPLVREAFDLGALTADVLETCAVELDKRKIRHILRNDAEKSLVSGDQNQIRQVLLNLVLNAMDAMPHGGELNTRLYTAVAGQVCLDVCDTGTGIPEKLLSTIHMPFISTKKNGLGLGLAKVYAVVEEHGGSVACSSEPGKGTRFTICLNRQKTMRQGPPNFNTDPAA